MITEKQQIWLEHLNDTDSVVIKPYDPESEMMFKEVVLQIQQHLGVQTKVLHRGATGLKISGQDEIDIYIPVPIEKFNSRIHDLSKLYGQPKSVYSLERAHFVTNQSRKHIDVFVINEEHEGWINSEIFTQYLLAHPEELKRYESLKESAAGQSTKKYYTIKIEYINYVLEKAKLK